MITGAHVSQQLTSDPAGRWSAGRLVLDRRCGAAIMLIVGPSGGEVSDADSAAVLK